MRENATHLMSMQLYYVWASFLSYKLSFIVYLSLSLFSLWFVDDVVINCAWWMHCSCSSFKPGWRLLVALSRDQVLYRISLLWGEHLSFLACKSFILPFLVCKMSGGETAEGPSWLIRNISEHLQQEALKQSPKNWNLRPYIKCLGPQINFYSNS